MAAKREVSLQNSKYPGFKFQKRVDYKQRLALQTHEWNAKGHSSKKTTNTTPLQFTSKNIYPAETLRLYLEDLRHLSNLAQT